MKSWKTTLGGVVALLSLAYNVITLMTDGDPNTNPDWNVVITSASAALALIFARDNTVTDEQANAGA